MLARNASVSAASVLVRADGAAFFRFRYLRPATATNRSVSTRQVGSTPEHSCNLPDEQTDQR
jgi:hypothetical protein